MSKMGQAVFEGQEFAQENYNVSRDEFIKLADTAFKSSATIQHQAAVEEWETIQNDLDNYDRYISGDPNNGFL